MANYVNWLQEDTAEFYAETHFGNTQGSASYVGDNDLSTRFAALTSYSYGQCPVARGFVEVTINFSKSNIRMDKIEFTIQTEINVSGLKNSKYDVQLYDGTWHTVSSGNSTSNIAYQTFTVNFSEYSNVSKIKIAVDGTGATNWGSGNARASIFEIKAWGNNYVDIGLRAYDGTNTIKIACEPNGTLTYPLRIMKGAIIYSIALVEPSDPSASKIRVKTNSGIKALVKIN